MRIKPDDNWRWYFDKDHDRVMLDISSQMVFRSRYPSKLLNADALTLCEPFNVDDASLFFQFDENCRHLKLSSEQRAELVLNAIVAHRFLKTTAPKSWYFTLQSQGYMPTTTDIVAVNIEQSGEDAILLVIDAHYQASQCIVAQPSLNLADKTYVLGDVIRIMNDRLMPVTFVVQEITHNFAEAI